MCIVYTILTGILLLAFQDPIMHLFTGDETVVAYGKICMLYFCPFYWMLGILQGLAGTVRGTGKSVPPMVVLLISCACSASSGSSLPCPCLWALRVCCWSTRCPGLWVQC